MVMFSINKANERLVGNGVRLISLCILEASRQNKSLRNQVRKKYYAFSTTNL